jgi:hypothetical protein
MAGNKGAGKRETRSHGRPAGHRVHFLCSRIGITSLRARERARNPNDAYRAVDQSAISFTSVTCRSRCSSTDPATPYWP